MSSTRLLLVWLTACGTVAESGGGDDGGMQPTENCFDGTDDDANGMPDCADPRCAGVAVCAPEASGVTAGILVEADQPCPAGFAGGETVIHKDVDDSGCSGCTCTPGTTTCRAELWTYSVATDCTADTAHTGGVYYGVITDTCTAEPVSMSYNGARAHISIGDQTCAAAGTPSRPASPWRTNKKFCKASRQAAGCASGSVCVARAAAPAEQCAIVEGAGQCAPLYQDTQDWYTGADDTRTCAQCQCTGTGGSCAPVQIKIGSDWLCDVSSPEYIGDGDQTCRSIYSPPARTDGAPLAPTSCDATSAFTGGAVTPTGPTTVCCAPAGA